MFTLVEFSQLYCNLSWVWLKDTEIKNLTMTPDFSRKEQSEFFNSLSSRSDYWIKGIQFDSQPIGAMGIKNIKANTGEYWGYIGEKNYWGKGIGVSMLDSAIAQGRFFLLKSIYLKVAESNIRAKKLYTKFGFTLEKKENGVEKFILQL